MSDLNLKCPADFQGGIQDDWDNDYASMWAQVQSLSHNKMQYRKAWMAAKDENTRLQSEVERLRGRCGELEEGLHGIANCAYGFSHPKAQTADEAASWMNGEAMRLLGDPQPSAWLLRKQAGAVEAATDDLRTEHKDIPETILSLKERALLSGDLRFLERYAQSLRQQAAESENG